MTKAGDPAPERAPGNGNLRPAWQPGQSGNPAGRGKGSRNKLADAFITELLTDWEANGKKAIEDMRAKSPTDYCKVVAAVIPKEVNHTVEDYDELSDDDLAAEFATVAARLAARDASRRRDRAQGKQAPLPN